MQRWVVGHFLATSYASLAERKNEAASLYGATDGDEWNVRHRRNVTDGEAASSLRRSTRPSEKGCAPA